MSGVISSVKRFFGLNQNLPLSRKRQLDRDSEDDDVIEVSSGKKQKLERSHGTARAYSPCKIVTAITTPIKSISNGMAALFDFKHPQEDLTFLQPPALVDLTEDTEEVPKLRHRSKNSLNSEMKVERSLTQPVTIQASEPTRLDSDQNEVHLLKVVNPNTSSAVGDEADSSIQYDSPLKSFGGFSENVRCSDYNGTTADTKPKQGLGKRFVLVTSKEKEKRKKNTSPSALTKQLKSGYRSVHDKFFFSDRNAPNRMTVGERFKFRKKKMSTAVKETYKLDEKVKYFNILNNLSSCSAHFIPYQSPGFSLLKTPRAGIMVEKADQTTTKMKTDRILTSTARKPDITPQPGPSVITLDSSFNRSGSDGSPGTCKTSLVTGNTVTKSPGYENSLEVSLRTNPVYSPLWLKQLRAKYDSKHREVDRRIAEQEIKKKFYEERNEETQQQLEERILRHMTITQVDVEDLELSEDEGEEELELPEITPEMEVVIQRAKRSGGEVLVDSHKIQITRKDIDTLKGLNWLNDEIINFYLQMIVERSAQKGLKVYATNTFFYPKMMISGQPALQRWTRKVDIFAQDIMLMPVHLGMHWCLAVVDFRKPGVYYYDSMGGNNKQCLTTLLKYLQDEYKDKKGGDLDVGRYEAKIMKDIPQQMNGSDCGMFACKFAEYISRGAPITFTQQDMPYFRKRMIWEIVKDTLLHP